MSRACIGAAAWCQAKCRLLQRRARRTRERRMYSWRTRSDSKVMLMRLRPACRGLALCTNGLQ